MGTEKEEVGAGRGEKGEGRSRSTTYHSIMQKHEANSGPGNSTRVQSAIERRWAEIRRTASGESQR